MLAFQISLLTEFVFGCLFFSVGSSVGSNISHFDITIYNKYVDNGTHKIPLHVSYPKAMELSSPESDEQWPLVVFMHGDPCEWWWYEYLVNYLVSKGFIVVLPASEEPLGPPPVMSLDMKYTLDYVINMSLYNDTIDILDPIYNNNNKATAKTTKNMKKIKNNNNDNDGKNSETKNNEKFKKIANPFYPNKINLNQLCAAGHSAGSDASIMSASKTWKYPFIYSYQSVVAMASFFDKDIYEAISDWNSQPIFIMAGSDDCICPPVGSRPIYSEFGDATDKNIHGVCRYYVEITNGTHCDFADIEVISNVCDDLESDACIGTEKENRTPIDRDIQLGLVQEYVYKYIKASLIDKTQNSYDQLYNEIKNEMSGTGYIDYLEYNCTV